MPGHAGRAAISSRLPCSIACQRLTTDVSRYSCPSPLPQGLVFAVGAERGVVKLYDARNWAAGPFTSFPVGPAALSVNTVHVACACDVRRNLAAFFCCRLGPHPAGPPLHGTGALTVLPARLPVPQVRDEINTGALFAYLKFSLDGQLLLAVAEGRIYLLDSFEGTVKQKVGDWGAVCKQTVVHSWRVWLGWHKSCHGGAQLLGMDSFRLAMKQRLGGGVGCTSW